MDGNESEAQEPVVNEALSGATRREINLKNLELSDRPGIPLGTELPTKKIYPTNALAEAAANRILSGTLVSNKCGPVTESDKKLIARIAQEPAEAFQARISSKLEKMADETAEIIFEKLRNDEFRPDTLPSLLAIAIDKLQVLNGRTSVTGSVHVQINNFGNGQPQPRESVLSQLGNLRGGKTPEMVEAIAV